MNNTNENLYKKSGELEQIGLESLPPTPLSLEAKETLETWGLTEEQIDFMRQFSSQFRYDLCAEKVDRLALNKAEIFTKGDQEFINLPSFYDVTGRLDGQCGDIGRQWVIQINELGLIDVLNAQRTDGSRIVTGNYSGQSKTHFCREGSNHVWNGLAIMDSEGGIVEEVYFDAAFQKIMRKSESGYTQKTATFDANCVEFSENADIPVGWLETSGASFEGQVPGMAVLGVSNDFLYSYLMGFARDKKTQAIVRLIARLDTEGDSSYFLYNEDGMLLSTDKVTGEAETEIRKLLDNVHKIEIEKREPTTNRVNWIRRDMVGLREEE